MVISSEVKSLHAGCAESYADKMSELILINSLSLSIKCLEGKRW